MTSLNELLEAWSMIIAERARQISEEGWTPEHDDHHSDGEMLRAAVLYIWHGTDKQPPSVMIMSADYSVPQGWPWDAKWWKPKSRERNLVRAGALCLAEHDRLVRTGRHTGPADHKLGIALRELLALRSIPPVEQTPVAWRWRRPASAHTGFVEGDWIVLRDRPKCADQEAADWQLQPLYASPVISPNDGLEEAAKVADEHARDAGDMAARGYYISEERAARNTARGIAAAIRALQHGGRE